MYVLLNVNHYLPINYLQHIIGQPSTKLWFLIILRIDKNYDRRNMNKYNLPFHILQSLYSQQLILIVKGNLMKNLIEHFYTNLPTSSNIE